MNNSFEPFWPKTEQVGLSDNPKRIDLGKPDAAAAELADTLQTAATNTFFTRTVLMLTRGTSFIFVWVLRPLLWLPLKFLVSGAAGVLAISQPSVETHERNKRARRRRDNAKVWGHDA